MMRTCFLVSIGILIPVSTANGQAPGWKAGVAKVNITPTEPMWMSGYAARTKPADGKLHDLWAKALVLQDAKGAHVALVSLDLVGIDRDLSLAMRSDIEKLHKLPRSAVMLACSHTHSGPVIRGNLDTMYFLDETQQRYRKEYTEKLKNQVVELVGDAIKNLRSRTVTRSLGQASFAVNRRNNPEKQVPDLIAKGMLRGPSDHDVPVLVVREPDGVVCALAVGYACHATTLDQYQWSGDYPGFAMDELEARYPGATALFWAGCGADQNPIPRRAVAMARDYGKQLADAVQLALRRPMLEIKPTLKSAYEEIDLPFAALPSREQIVNDAAAADKYVASRAKYLLARLEKGESLSNTYPYPVQAWKLGEDLIWIALAGEVVVDYSIKLKTDLGMETTWVAGYANDVMAYIPSLRVLKEGGYEGGGAMVYYGLPAVWSPEVESRILSSTRRLVETVNGR